MKQVIFIIILSSVSKVILGQSDTYKKRYVYFELAGSGGLGSINYEVPLLKKSKIEYTFRSGFSIAPIDKNNGFGLVFPLMVNSIIGRGTHKLELGVGQGITVTTRGSFFILTTACLGYRHQPETKRWFYRITYTPLISYLVDFQVQQWAGFSIGYTLYKK